MASFWETTRRSGWPGVSTQNDWLVPEAVEKTDWPASLIVAFQTPCDTGGGPEVPGTGYRSAASNRSVPPAVVQATASIGCTAGRMEAMNVTSPWLFRLGGSKSSFEKVTPAGRPGG